MQTQVKFHPASISFYQFFEVIHTKFKICFETIAKKFAIQCKKSRYKVSVHLLPELLVDAFLKEQCHEEFAVLGQKR